MGEFDNLFGVGEDDPQFGEMQRQQALADMLRKRAGSSGPGFAQAGEVVIPTLGSSMASMFDAKNANRMQSQADIARDQFNTRRNKSRESFLSQILRAQGIDQPAQAPGFQTNPQAGV